MTRSWFTSATGATSRTASAPSMGFWELPSGSSSGSVPARRPPVNRRGPDDQLGRPAGPGDRVADHGRTHRSAIVGVADGEAMLALMMDQVGVIGAGAWGTTLAIRLADGERPVTLWAHSSEANEELASRRENVRYLPGHVLPPNVRVATDEGFFEEPFRLFIVAVPSAHVRSVLRRL